VAILQECCKNVAGLLQEYCRIIARLFRAGFWAKKSPPKRAKNLNWTSQRLVGEGKMFKLFF